MITLISSIPIRLGFLTPGLIFTNKERTYFALKTEYRVNGSPTCYLLESGEAFSPSNENGKALNEEDFLNLPVYPVILSRVSEEEF